MDTTTVESLRAGLTGEAIVPGEDGYEALSGIWVYPGHPAVIIRARTNEDVVAGIAFARAQKLELSVRSGGHSNVGYSTNVGGVVLDLSPLNTIEVLDEDTRLVRLGTGARWIEVADALEPYGLGISSGDTASVGVGGVLVGGGIGWIVRKFGLSIDSVVGADVVTVDGRVVRASEQENPDLFWAIRGGSGNFGVVTSFDITAQRVGRVFFGTIAFPAEEREAILKGWSAYMRGATEDLTSTAQLWPTFGGELAPLNIVVTFAGDDEAAAAKAIDPIRQLGTVLTDSVELKPYGGVLENVSELPPGWVPRVKNRLTPSVNDGLIETILAEYAKLDTLYVEIRGIGGALSRLPADATAFAHRATEGMVMGVLLGSPEDNAPLMPLYDAFWDAVAPYMSGAYTGFLSVIDESDISAAYPDATYRRLAAVKRKYDPENVFHLNPNITPAADEG